MHANITRIEQDWQTTANKTDGVTVNGGNLCQLVKKKKKKKNW
jgi:peptidase E